MGFVISIALPNGPEKVGILPDENLSTKHLSSKQDAFDQELQLIEQKSKWQSTKDWLKELWLIIGNWEFAVLMAAYCALTIHQQIE
eukprot:gene5650-2463_t